MESIAAERWVIIIPRIDTSDIWHHYNNLLIILGKPVGGCDEEFEEVNPMDWHTIKFKKDKVEVLKAKEG